MSSSANDSISIVVWSLVAVVAIVIGFALVVWLKKWMNQPEEPPSAGFSLEDLRQLHREGKLSSDEYERARARMMASLLREQKPKKPA